MASELETLMAIESHGDLNPYQRSRLEQLKRDNPNVGGFAGGVPTFNFDYAKAATDAYGELGPYYLRLLTESRGDLNKVLARLTEDYDRGLRIKTEDRALATENATRNVTDNALARGIYQKSVYDPSGGMGLADENLRRNIEPINTAFNRWKTEADIDIGRQRTDLPEAQARDEFRMEQERREKAAALAETRGARAYQDFQAKQLYNPSLT